MKDKVKDVDKYIDEEELTQKEKIFGQNSKIGSMKIIHFKKNLV